MNVFDAKRVKELEAENARLKKLLAESMLENEVTRASLRKVVSAPSRRDLVRSMISSGLSQRHALRVIGVSASAFCYQPAPDPNQARLERIVALAQRYRCYGSGMIYLKPRQTGMTVNHKRVDRLYAEEKLQELRRKRKRVSASDLQPLRRPQSAIQVW